MNYEEVALLVEIKKHLFSNEPNFSKQEEFELIDLYLNNNKNQFFNKILEKACLIRKFSKDKSEVFDPLLDFLIKHDELGKRTKSENATIIEYAKFSYNVLFLIDIK